MSAAVILQYRSLVAKATPQKADMKTRKGVVRGRTPKAHKTKAETLNDHQTNESTVNAKLPLRGGDRSWGKDSFLPPNSMAPEPPARRRAMARRSANPRHLGASSPSGNVRDECRGWSPWSKDK